MLGSFLEAMLDPYSGHVELMLSQEQRVPFKSLPGPKGTRRFWMFLDHVGTMLGLYRAYVGPMLIHVRLLEAMLGPYSSHFELMLSQERRVPFNSFNLEGVTRWKLAALGYRFPLGLGFRCELSSQSEKSIERVFLPKRLEICS